MDRTKKAHLAPARRVLRKENDEEREIEERVHLQQTRSLRKESPSFEPTNRLSFQSSSSVERQTSVQVFDSIQDISSHSAHPLA